MRRLATGGVLALLLFGTMTIVEAPAHAVTCPPATVGGAPLGSITVGDISVPLKPVTYRAGGTLRPPPTNQAAGLSTVNTPLDAREGTTVIAWHVRYGKGCNGTLNPLLRLPKGAIFAVQGIGKPAREYRIIERHKVPRGKLKPEWFTPVGPHRIALFTCGDLQYERFNSTVVTIAESVTDSSPES